MEEDRKVQERRYVKAEDLSRGWDWQHNSFTKNGSFWRLTFWYLMANLIKFLL